MPIYMIFIPGAERTAYVYSGAELDSFIEKCIEEGASVDTIIIRVSHKKVEQAPTYEYVLGGKER